MKSKFENAGNELVALCETMATLRGENGCGWDRVQTLETLKPYLIEEAYEVLEAIESKSTDAHREELGDLLLQVVYQSQIQTEQNVFDMGDVCKAIREKLVRRHPHVFGERTKQDVGADNPYWNEIKAKEKPNKKTGTLDGLPAGLPALMLSQKTQAKAADVGFDWGDISQTIAKIEEELAEVKEAIALKDQKHIEHEIGDLLMTITQLARWVNADAEQSLRGAVGRFRARFSKIEEGLKNDQLSFKDVSLDELIERWRKAKEELSRQPA